MSTLHTVPLTLLPFASDPKRDEFSSSSSLTTSKSLYKTISPIASSLTSNSTSSSTSDFADLKGDLLPDLWQPALNYAEPLQAQLPPTSVTHPHPHSHPVTSGWSQPSFNQNYDNYGHHLHQPTLTEENLIFNSDVDSPPHSHRMQSFSSPVYFIEEAGGVNGGSDEMFNFEKQQQQQQQHQQQQQQQQQYLLYNRNGSTSSASSLDEYRSPSFNKVHQASVNTQLYKTELCASFMKMGICPYGNKCQFAHGENELKNVERPPKWRSKACANWTKFGSCRYGNRCCFKHGD
ncbi:zinc finger-containing protein [Scheffersomyces amazonensis]|uniref:zinc finger-containing protein n=1 Tax=Scheffersomyces amazonensis TaxID=1078765 RepID=UPI00315DDE7A